MRRDKTWTRETGETRQTITRALAGTSCISTHLRDFAKLVDIKILSLQTANYWLTALLRVSGTPLLISPIPAHRENSGDLTFLEALSSCSLLSSPIHKTLFNRKCCCFFNPNSQIFTPECQVMTGNHRNISAVAFDTPSSNCRVGMIIGLSLPVIVF